MYSEAKKLARIAGVRFISLVAVGQALVATRTGIGEDVPVPALAGRNGS